MHSPQRNPLEGVRRFLSSAEFASVLTTVIFGVLLCSYLIPRLMGAPAYTTMVTALVICALLSAGCRRREISWGEQIPITLVVFVLWCCISIAWASRPSATWSSLLYQVAVLILGLYIACFRDHIQIIRSLGNALRTVLIVSLALEILSGVLLDLPIVFLRITGNITSGGPVQGIFGSRNTLAFITVIAVITTVIEWRTKSIQPGLAVFSLAVAASLLIFSQSAIQTGVIAGVFLMLLAILIIRRRSSDERSRWQFGLFAFIVVFAVIAWLMRNTIVSQLRVTNELNVRLTLWQSVLDTARQNPLEGWGWVGAWPSGVQPYFAINFDIGQKHQSALSTFFDAYLQVGMVGLVLFLAVLVLAFIRATLVASSKRSSVFIWPVLIITALAITGLAQSDLLVGSGWLLLVVTVALTSQNMSWRSRLRPLPASEQDGSLRL